MSEQVVVYGAYGYTGTLVSEAAADRDVDLVLAGRNERQLEPLADRLDVPSVVTGVDDDDSLAAMLRDATAVLHCAGPFVHTYEPMLSACLRTGTDYLDITGEIDVFAAVAAESDRATEAGVTLLPGVGFDVVPTDCLAAHLASRLPAATTLDLAFTGGGGLSPGTLKTTVEHLDAGGAVRRDGEIRRAPVAQETRTVDFGWDVGERHVASIPWGDVVTAYHTTGIPTVTVSMGMHPATARRQRSLARLGPLLGTAPVKRVLQWLVDWRVPGPDEETRAATGSYVWGEATRPDGERAVARLRCPNTYETTVDTALACVERVLAGEADPGYQTPAGAFGADLILSATDAEREDVH
jgi:short subunit dehydrogenase-like uncharacterized protein